MMTPTARTLAALRKLGYLAAVVEKWLPRIKRRQDLFGFGDVLAVHPGDRVFMIVQATTGSNVASRLNKARALPALTTWLGAGGTFEVWGWKKMKGRWHVRRVAVDAELQAVELTPRRRRRHRNEP
jgi:hypothetical protein